jgi:hypothetical protein
MGRRRGRRKRATAMAGERSFAAAHHGGKVAPKAALPLADTGRWAARRPERSRSARLHAQKQMLDPMTSWAQEFKVRQRGASQPLFEGVFVMHVQD